MDYSISRTKAVPMALHTSLIHLTKLAISCRICTSKHFIFKHFNKIQPAIVKTLI